MSKNNSYEKIRSEVAHRYNNEIISLKNEICLLRKYSEGLLEENKQLKAELEEKDKSIKELESLCNMTEEERFAYVEKQESIHKNGEIMKVLAVGFGNSVYKDLITNN